MKARALDRPVLAHGKVRFVGEGVALVVADSAAAEDAAALVEVDYRELQAIVDSEQTLAPGAPQLDDAVPGNLVYESETGSEAAVTAAIKSERRVGRRLYRLPTRIGNRVGTKTCPPYIY